jgi:hypothetical protein
MSEFKSASEFLRSLSPDLPTQEAISLAAKEGFKVTSNLVRIVRFHLRHKGNKSTAIVKARRAPARKTRAPKKTVLKPLHKVEPTKKIGRPRKVTPDSDLVGTLVNLILDLGTAKVKSVLSQIEGLVA